MQESLAVTKHEKDKIKRDTKYCSTFIEVKFEYIWYPTLGSVLEFLLQSF